MTRTREVHYYDHTADFGLSGLAGTVCSRAALRLDGPVVLTLAAAEEDARLGHDARLLADSALPDAVLHAVWLAAVRRCFDPAEGGTDVRAWLRRVAELCPPYPPERDPYEARALGAARPQVPEATLREAVAAEIEVMGLQPAVAVPDIVPALLRVVREVDADLGFRLFVRAAKAYSVPVGKEPYDRLLAIGESLAFPVAAVAAELNVRWPPIDSGKRDFALGRFGLPVLAAVFRGTDWQYQGTVRENVRTVTDQGPGEVPGSHAAVLLEDVRRLLDSPLSDRALTTLWLTAAQRRPAPGEFDAEVRAWLEEVAEVCREHLAAVDPCYRPVRSPARTGLAGPVLREVREAGLGGPEEEALAAVVTEVDPDLGFRLLLQTLGALEVPVTEVQRGRFRSLAAEFRYGADHVDEVLPV